MLDTMFHMFAKLHPETRKVLWQLLGVLALVAIVAFFSAQIADNGTVRELVSRFGYPGIFVFAAASGFNLIFPVPAISFIELFLASGFSFVALIATISFGQTIGDSVGYLIGTVGAHVAESTDKKTHPRIIQLLDWLHHKRDQYRVLPYVVLFFYVALAPIPNEGLVIPMAFAGYRFRYIFPVILAGNILFNITVATGILSLASVLG